MNIPKNEAPRDRTYKVFQATVYLNKYDKSLFEK